MIKYIECTNKRWVQENKSALIETSFLATISIIDPDSDFIFNSNISRVCSVKFSDIEPTPFLKHSFICENEIFMNSKHANKIVSFINQLVSDDNEWRLIVHCSAGICRSGAVATFAQPFSTMKDSHFASVNMHINPNKWVLDKLIEEWFFNWRSELKVIQQDNLFE